MKAVVVHASAAPVELDWSKQFAGLDAQVKNDFSALDWSVRSPRVFTISGFTWDAVVSTVSAAAVAAGNGGVVIIASGHGGAVLSGDPDAQRFGGMVNWDPTDTRDVDRAWIPQKIHRGLFWDNEVVDYLVPIPFGNPPTRKGADEERIKNKAKGWEMSQKRHDAFDALVKVGQALKANGVARLTFTVCTAGHATGFMDRLAGFCQAEVACFSQPTVVLDDGTFGFNPGKARLVLERDQPQNGRGTNIPQARVFSPNLDDNSIAYVGKP
jgi:hypothetical protein